LKILDLGSHDGYVSTFVGRALDGLTVDGLDLHPRAVAVATERAARHGIPGEFKIGLAEDAPNLFEPGTYDAVVAFELIEHVPDVPRFLDALEVMCKPGGRVYISTPDGTFGAGQNPNHLRAYRAVDLADLLRRRGTLTDMAVGPDTISVASYEPRGAGEPAPLGDCAIYTGPAWKPWSPMDIERPGCGLGGSETAAVRLAEALHDLGYVVTVYGDVEPCAWKQVIFRHHSVFDPLQERALVVASRAPHLFDRPINAAAKVLWMHDTDYGPALTEERAVHADAVMVLSRWHAGHVRSLYPFLADRIRLTGNAIEPSYFMASSGDATGVADGTSGADDKPVRNRTRAIYSSSPDRGLDFLLELWPEVRKRVPGAELAYCYSDVYDAVAAQNPGLAAFRDRVARLSEQEGVVNLGPCSQDQLAREMMRSHVWLAPSWNGQHDVRFHETYCIGAVEAAAAGCHRIVSGWGALPERNFRDNTLEVIAPARDSDDSTPPNREQWIEAIAETFNYMPLPQSAEALSTTWSEVAADFHMAATPSAEAVAA
jgi:glycosyltransferase involved in cell wall biosynthesis